MTKMAGDAIARGGYTTSVMSQMPPSKACATCGRHFSYRKRWARVWDSVKFCSGACRKHKVGSKEVQLEQSILTLLHACGRGKTICPSQAARAVYGEAAGLMPQNMQRTRAAARRLCTKGQLAVTQGGRVVDPDTARGPIRLKLTGEP